MMTRNFGMGFFGRGHFDKDVRKQFQEKWSKMTDSEKLEFMNKRVEHMEEDHFSVEAMDARCEGWMKMTPEEKQAFVDKRKQAFEGRMSGMSVFYGHMHP
ncbi:MAG: hypothetical protein M0Q41_09775 [Bacteroidales bacterium]|nr:hypothetical protein [Bacteroidales bacterium]